MLFRSLRPFHTKTPKGRKKLLLTESALLRLVNLNTFSICVIFSSEFSAVEFGLLRPDSGSFGICFLGTAQQNSTYLSSRKKNVNPKRNLNPFNSTINYYYYYCLIITTYHTSTIVVIFLKKKSFHETKITRIFLKIRLQIIYCILLHSNVNIL